MEKDSDVESGTAMSGFCDAVMEGHIGAQPWGQEEAEVSLRRTHVSVAPLTEGHIGAHRGTRKEADANF